MTKVTSHQSWNSGTIGPLPSLDPWWLRAQSALLISFFRGAGIKNLYRGCAKRV